MTGGQGNQLRKSKAGAAEHVAGLFYRNKVINKLPESSFRREKAAAIRREGPTGYSRCPASGERAPVSQQIPLI